MGCDYYEVRKLIAIMKESEKYKECDFTDHIIYDLWRDERYKFSSLSTYNFIENLPENMRILYKKGEWILENHNDMFADEDNVTRELVTKYLTETDKDFLLENCVIIYIETWYQER